MYETSLKKPIPICLYPQSRKRAAAASIVNRLDQILLGTVRSAAGRRLSEFLTQLVDFLVARAIPTQSALVRVTTTTPAIAAVAVTEFFE